MPDIRSNGKLIYQLTSASALKDTDLFVISSSDNLTRSVSLSQVKAAVSSSFYNKEAITEMLDEIKSQIKEISDSQSDSDIDIAEFKNEIINQLHLFKQNELIYELNNIRNEFNETLNDFQKDIDNRFLTISGNMDKINESLSQRITNVDTSLNNRINEVYNTLSERITEIDAKLTDVIDGLITYGTDIPTTLGTGKIYLQYF